MDQKAKGALRKYSSENGGRLAHQKTVGSKQKKLHNAAKHLEQRIELLGDVKPPEAIRSVQFRQSKALELHNPFPITGANGTGKTTLFNMILNREDGNSLLPKAEMGIFAQNGYKIDRNQGVMAFMQENCDYQVSEIRAVLAAMGFSHHDVRKELSVLSGGEIIKLQLAKMLLGPFFSFRTMSVGGCSLLRFHLTRHVLMPNNR